MGEFYIKNKKGAYIPVSFKQIATKEWDNKLVVVRIGSDELPADEAEIEEVMRGLNDADALDELEGTSFLVSLYGLQFEVLDNIKDLGNKCMTVRVTGGDDISKLGALQQNAKRQLRGLVKKIIFMPAPLTVDEYNEVMDVKRRCDIRKSRRGS